jgi:hypothetical protein
MNLPALQTPRLDGKTEDADAQVHRAQNRGYEKLANRRYSEADLNEDGSAS